MKKLWASMALFLCLTASAMADCKTISSSAFLSAMMTEDNIRVMKMKEPDRIKLVGYISQLIKMPFPAQSIYAGFFKDNPKYIGFAYFDKDNCLLPAGMIKMTKEEFLKQITLAGLSDEPFDELSKS